MSVVLQFLPTRGIVLSCAFAIVGRADSCGESIQVSRADNRKCAMSAAQKS